MQLSTEVGLPEPIKNFDRPVGQPIPGNVLEEEGNCSTVHVLQPSLNCRNDVLVGW